MLRRIVLACLMSVLVSCQSQPLKGPVVSSSQTPAMAQLEANFFNDLFTLYPRWGSSLGKREYDAELPAMDKTFQEKRKQFVAKYEAHLKEMPINSLTDSEKVDVRILENFIAKMKWDIEEFKRSEWDPSMYNVGDSLATLLESDMPQADREKNLQARLEKVPAYYDSAITNLRSPTKEHLQLAIRQNKGTVAYMQNTLGAIVSKTGNTALEGALKSAQAATLVFVQKLEKLDVALQKSNGYKSFRIGPKLYRQKFELDLQVKSSPEEVYAFAVKEKNKTLDEMVKITRKLWRKYFPKKPKPKSEKEMVAALVHHLAEQHARPEEFVEKVRAQLPELWKFVEGKKLLDLDSSKPLTVRLTPEYEQGFSIASVDAPGPFDPNRDTFYNVMPFDKMDAAKIDSFLKEYNSYTMQILNIHEAIPGHYAQLVYSKKNPSLVKSILGNDAMVEGWAVYSERMMLENGYGNNEPELWLMYHKWYLRVVYNMILDYEIHNKNLSRRNALRVLMEDVFQEQTEAEYKWDRATYSQVQLATYFTGFSEIYRFREQLKKNKNFDLRQFHERFLGYGSAPIGEIIYMMTATEKEAAVK